MTNQLRSPNDEHKLGLAPSSFEHSSFLRHSSLELCHSQPLSILPKIRGRRAHFQMEMFRGRGNLPAKQTMNPVKGEQLVTQLNWRYATKKFDPTRKLSPEDWAALEPALILSHSSYGLQPW